MRLRLVFIVSLMVLARVGFALDLAHTTVRLDDTSLKQRQAAFRTGLKRVLIKYSGDSFIVTHPLIKQQLTQAKNYLDTYQYSRQDDQLALRLGFSTQAIEQLLLSAKHPIWGVPRPTSLIWFVRQTTVGRRLEYADSNDAIMASLQLASKRRGLPLILPLNDLQGLTAVTPEDVWQFTLPVIKQASQRYNTSDILLARLQINHHGIWQATWLAIVGDNRVLWQTQAQTLPQVIHAGVDTYANALAKRAFLQQSSINPLNHHLMQRLMVEHIGDLRAYTAVRQYLQQLAPVQQVNTLRIEADYVVFTVEITGGRQALLNAIAIDGRLHYDKKASEMSDAMMIFNWQK